MMTGVLNPTRGNIKVLGLDVWKNQIAVKQVTGNVPEMANVYLSFSGWQKLMFIGEIYAFGTFGLLFDVGILIGFGFGFLFLAFALHSKTLERRFRG